MMPQGEGFGPHGSAPSLRRRPSAPALRPQPSHDLVRAFLASMFNRSRSTFGLTGLRTPDGLA